MRKLITVFAVLAVVLASVGCERAKEEAKETEAEKAATAEEEMAEEMAEEQAEAKEGEEAAEEQMEEMEEGDQTIVEVAREAGSFNTLVSAIEKAELQEALSGEGPFTVFAPTDDAFDALPEGTLTKLLQPENKKKLQSILKYHVIEGEVMAEDVSSGDVETLQGDKAKVEVDDDGVTYAGATVTDTDIEASNGVIHVIDKVVMPPEKKAPTN